MHLRNLWMVLSADYTDCQIIPSIVFALTFAGTPSRIATREPRNSITTLPAEVCHSTRSPFSLILLSGYRFDVRFEYASKNSRASTGVSHAVNCDTNIPPGLTVSYNPKRSPPQPAAACFDSAALFRNSSRIR